MCIYIYISIYLSIYLSISLSLSIYIYIYIYIEMRSKLVATRRPSSARIEFSERDKWGQHLWGHCEFHVFLTEGPFWVLPSAYFYLPKCASAYFFPQSVKFITVAAAPLVLTPFVRDQLRHGQSSRVPSGKTSAAPGSSEL